MNAKKEFNEEDKAVFSFAVTTFLRLLAPVLPHMTEEIYQGLGGKCSVHTLEWPKYEEALAKTSTITLVVQINGKVKDKLEADAETSKEDMEKLALKAAEKLASQGISRLVEADGKRFSIIKVSGNIFARILPVFSYFTLNCAIFSAFGVTTHDQLVW